MIMKRITALLAAPLITMTLAAQPTNTDKRILNHLDIAVTAGTTGIGFDLAMPIGNYVGIRAGGTFIPHFTKDLHFDVQVGEYDPTLTKKENRKLQKSRFEKLSEVMNSFTGYDLRREVTMQYKHTMYQFKFMVDVHPFKKNHNWHFTAGLYLGNRRIGTAVNSREDTPSLMAVNIYNSIYWKSYYEQDIFSYNGMGGQLPPQVTNSLLSYGSMGYPVGTFKDDFYATQDIYYDHDVYDKENYDRNGNYLLLHHKGDVQYHKGELMYKAGDEYLMTPDEQATVSADAFVNVFRPYIGFGYGGPVTKDKRTSISFDLGVMFWGGRPDVITHEGVNMTTDLKDMKEDVERYMNIVKLFPVYPILELRIAHTIF